MPLPTDKIIFHQHLPLSAAVRVSLGHSLIQDTSLARISYYG